MSMSLTGSRGAAGNKIPKGYAAGKIQQFGPEQMDLFRRLFSYTAPGSQLAGLAAGNEAAFAPQEEQATRDFQKFQGQTASRFSQLAPAAMSATRGSGFKNLQTQGAQDFALQLAAQRQGLQRQALMDLMGISQSLLSQRPEAQFLVKQELPFWKQLALGGVQGLGSGLSSLLGGGGLGGLFGRGSQQQQAQFQPTTF
jgi:hypothetical protein